MNPKRLFSFIVIFLIISCNSSPKRIVIDHRSNKTSTSHNIKKRVVKCEKIISCNSNKKSTSLKKGTQVVEDNTKHVNKPTSWRIDLPGGGYANYVQQADGSLTVTRIQPCTFCQGTKICPACRGAGGVIGRAYGGMYYPCTMCMQTGICKSCRGEGYVSSISRTDVTGNTNTMSSNGYSAFGGPGGNFVIDPNGRITGRSSGGGTFTSRGKSKSKGRDRSNDYIETIQNAPNYTGEPDVVWCEKCKDFLPRHSHVKNRVY